MYFKNKIFLTILIYVLLNIQKLHAQRDTFTEWFPGGDNLFLKYLEMNLDLEQWQFYSLAETEREIFTLIVSDSATIDSFISQFSTNSMLHKKIKNIVENIPNNKFLKINTLKTKGKFLYNLEIKRTLNGFDIYYSTDNYIPEPNEKITNKNRWMIFVTFLLGAVVYYYYTQ